MNQYRVTIAANRSRFCAVYDVRALDVCMATYRAMSHAELSPGGDYDVTTRRVECNLGNSPEVHCLSITA